VNGLNSGVQDISAMFVFRLMCLYCMIILQNILMCKTNISNYEM